MTRILIADPSDVIRSGLRYILETQPDWEVVAEAADGKEAILEAIRFEPNVAVIEYFLPVLDGLEVTDHIRRRCPNTEILIFTTLESECLVFNVLAAGARGFMLKSDTNRDLVEAIASLADHRPFFSGRISAALIQSFLTRRFRCKDMLANPERRSSS